MHSSGNRARQSVCSATISRIWLPKVCTQHKISLFYAEDFMQRTCNRSWLFFPLCVTLQPQHNSFSYSGVDFFGQFYLEATKEILKNNMVRPFCAWSRDQSTLKAAQISTPVYGSHFCWCSGALDTDSKKNAADHSRLKNTLTWRIPNNTAKEQNHHEFKTSHKCRWSSRLRDATHT